MALILHLYYTGIGDHARRFAEEMETSGVADRIRAEKGTLRYEYYLPLNDPQTVLLIDAWRDQAALDAHHASPMMTEIAALREKHDLHMKVERLTDSNEGADADTSFIRS